MVPSGLRLGMMMKRGQLRVSDPPDPVTQAAELHRGGHHQERHCQTGDCQQPRRLQPGEAERGDEESGRVQRERKLSLLDLVDERVRVADVVRRWAAGANRTVAGGIAILGDTDPD